MDIDRQRTKLIGFVLVVSAFTVLGVWAAVHRSIGQPSLPEADQAQAQPASSSAAALLTESPTEPVPTLVPTPQLDLPVLMYHYVQVVTDPDDQLGFNLSVTPADLRAQLSYLKDNGFTTIDVNDLPSVWRGEVQLPNKSILLTFDDGYADFYSAAFPLLKEFQMKATLFVVTNFADKPGYVSWADIREMHQSGLVTIGAHSVSHADLTKTARASQEITEAKRIIEAQIGAPVTSFCYPSGRLNDTVVNLVDQAGYATAFTTQPGTILAETARLTLPRVRINGGTTLAQFAAKVH